MATTKKSKRAYLPYVGETLNRLTILELISGDGPSEFNCLCSCGTQKTIRASSVVRGLTKSCGCAHKDKPKTIKHGMSRTSTYRVWVAMKRRCLKENDKFYSSYGGRGIKVCDRWLESFDNFYSDMGKKPKGKSLDRIDNDKGYSPNNCRWATQKQQTRNTRKNTLLTLDGKTLCMSEWSELTGIPSSTISARINTLGWSVERALTTPVRFKAKSQT